MKILIHRGTNEIGGTVVELSTDTSRILLDLGLPLSPDSKPVEVKKLNPDGVFISHPHQDHFGLINELPEEVPVYIGELGRKLIDATKMFLGKELDSNNFLYISNKTPVTVGDFTITPYLVDHSSVDAYSFLVEAKGKRVLYSGDFRAHGRKAILFERMIKNPPKDIDVLLMEGTMMRRDNKDFPTESAVEDKIVQTIKDQKNISFLICSSQNIDRIVSAYLACLKTKKKLVVDFYTAWVLEKIKYVSGSVPNIDWDHVCLYADYHPDQIIKKNLDYFGDFRKRAYGSRVTKDELQENPSNYLVVSKMSKFNVIDLYKIYDSPLNVIYSQWLGYLDCSNEEYYGAEEVSAYRDDPKVDFVYAHTSGHAVLNDLKRFAEAVNPKLLIPIHTECRKEYEAHFMDVAEINDGKPFYF
jgi:ribonuclease J